MRVRGALSAQTRRRVQRRVQRPLVSHQMLVPQAPRHRKPELLQRLVLRRKQELLLRQAPQMLELLQRLVLHRKQERPQRVRVPRRS